MDENAEVQLHQGLIYSIARRFKPSNATELEEYIQEGNVALLKALRKYNKDKGNQISTLAWIYVYRAINKYHKSRKKNREQQCHIPTCIEPTKTDLWEILPSNLSKRETIVIQMKWQGYTFEEIGKKFGLTKSWASRLFKQTLQRVKEANINE